MPEAAATDPIQFANNYFLSPALAPDVLLKDFPPTSIVVGGLDPLLDDAIDFNTRLRRLDVPGELKVYRGLPHGFFAFGLLPHAAHAVDTARRWCQDSLGLAGHTERIAADGQGKPA